MRALASLLAATSGNGVRDTPLAVALALAVVAALCSGAGGVAAIVLHGARMPLHRVALWHAALGAALLFGGVCDLLPEAAAGLSPVGAVGWFALGAGGATVVGRVLSAWAGGGGGRGAGGVGGDGARLLGECDAWHALPLSRAASAGDGSAVDSALCERREVLVTGLAVFVCMSTHNVLEGMSILVAAHDGVDKGLRLAAAVSLENLPEGLAIALPILYATRSPRTAIWLALLSGMAEPAGVLAAGLVMRPGTSQTIASALLAVVSGILVSLALGQILPLAVKRSPRAQNVQLTAWTAVGMLCATVVQPLLMYHGRVGAIR